MLTITCRKWLYMYVHWVGSTTTIMATSDSEVIADYYVTISTRCYLF